MVLGLSKKSSNTLSLESGVDLPCLPEKEDHFCALVSTHVSSQLSLGVSP